MKDSNTLAGNATIKQLQREILLDTEVQYMKELNTLVINAIITFLLRTISQGTKKEKIVGA